MESGGSIQKYGKYSPPLLGLMDQSVASASPQTVFLMGRDCVLLPFISLLLSQCLARGYQLANVEVIN